MLEDVDGTRVAFILMEIPSYDDGSRIKSVNLLALEHISMSIVDSTFRRCEDDVFVNSFQPSRRDALHHPHDDFQPFLGRFDTYSFEHLDIFYE